MSGRPRPWDIFRRNVRFVPDNQIDLLENGDMFFPALKMAIDSARHEIFLETYIFNDDPIGRRISAALMGAAHRGVQVRLLVDGFGSSATPREFFLDMQATGVAIHFYRSLRSRFDLRRNRLRRLHRKLCCIDGRVAFAGGINIEDDLDVPGILQPRFDYAVSVRGPLVDQIRETMADLWRRLEWARLKRRPGKLPVPPASLPAGNQRAGLVIRDNLFHRHAIERAYLSAIGHARETIIIANAYFIPGRRIRHALIEAARRKVRVILLLQGRVEYWLQHYATLAMYGQLLSAGIEIYEYQVANIHAKAAVVDKYWATVGSSNLDPYSLILAREANIVVVDRTFNGMLRKSLEEAMASKSRQIFLESWQARNSLQKLRDWLAYGIVRILASMASPRDRLY
jgi:cardiolipin synthase